MNRTGKFIKWFSAGFGMFITLMLIFLVVQPLLVPLMGGVLSVVVALGLLTFLVGVSLALYKDYVRHKQNKEWSE